MRETFMEEALDRLREAAAEKSFEAAFTLAVDYAFQIAELNRLGRSQERAERKFLDEKDWEALGRETLRENFKPDKYFREERAFCAALIELTDSVTEHWEEAVEDDAETDTEDGCASDACDVGALLDKLEDDGK